MPGTNIFHDGFGLHRFKVQMSGPQYAQMFIDEVESSDIDVKLNTMVLDINKEKVIHAVNTLDGVIEIKAKAIILAMGCRERTKNQVFIWGTRPSGVMTAGSIQRYMNIEGLLPGKKAVILGSGDNVALVLPQKMNIDNLEEEVKLYMRTKKVIKNAVVNIFLNEKLVHSKKYRIVRPPEMVITSFPKDVFKDLENKGQLVVEIVKEGN